MGNAAAESVPDWADLALQVWETPGHCDGHLSFDFRGSDRRYLIEALARETVIFGPDSTDQAHRDVEWVEIDQFEKAAEIYARRWALA